MIEESNAAVDMALSNATRTAPSVTRPGNSPSVVALLVLAVGGCDTSGCNGGGGLDFTNGVDPASATPAVLVDVEDVSIWTSSWDNPPIQGLVMLSDDHAATRAGSDWSYSRFDLDVDDGSSFPIPWPQQNGTYTSDACPTCLGPNMFWEAHGLKLGAG